MTTIKIWIQVEAQWVEPVSLTFHSVLRKLYTEPSICLPTQFRSIWLLDLRGEYFFRNQPISNKHCLWWPCSLTDRDKMGRSWPWSYGSLNYNYLCHQCLSPLMLSVQISNRVRCTTLCHKLCQWLTASRWFSPSSPVFSTNRTDSHVIAEILLKSALNTIK